MGALVIIKEWTDGLWIIFGLVDQNSDGAIIFCSLRLIEVFNLKTCPHKGRYKVPLCPVVLLQQHTGECFWEWWLSVKIAKIGVERRNGARLHREGRPVQASQLGSGSLFEGSARSCLPGFHLKCNPCITFTYIKREVGPQRTI